MGLQPSEGERIESSIARHDRPRPGSLRPRHETGSTEAADRTAIGDLGRREVGVSLHQLATSIHAATGTSTTGHETGSRPCGSTARSATAPARAVPLHQSATIDLRQGHDGWGDQSGSAPGPADQPRDLAACAGEASALYQLGELAHRIGLGHAAATLVAICGVIDQSIGHGEVEADHQRLVDLLAALWRWHDGRTDQRCD